jgi:hypothetical protein
MAHVPFLARMYSSKTKYVQPYHHRQVLLTVAAAQWTVYLRLGSDSHVTVPELLTRMNLYSTAVPGASLTVPDHKGLLEEYCEALRATALSGFQLPREEMLPVLLHD